MRISVPFIRRALMHWRDRTGMRSKSARAYVFRLFFSYLPSRITHACATSRRKAGIIQCKQRRDARRRSRKYNVARGRGARKYARASSINVDNYFRKQRKRKEDEHPLLSRGRNIGLLFRHRRIPLNLARGSCKETNYSFTIYCNFRFS